VTLGGAAAIGEEQPASAPSSELLEFLAEFGELDEQTFELIVFHGLDDYQKENAQKNHDNNEGGSAEVQDDSH